MQSSKIFATHKTCLQNLFLSEKTDNNVPHSSRVTYEVVYGWSLSFENLMKHRCKKNSKLLSLSNHLTNYFQLDKSTSPSFSKGSTLMRTYFSGRQKARIIYEDFISILSPKEVSLDSRVREIVNTNMGRPSASTFDDAQGQIYTLMQRDSYPRFLASPIYKACVANFGVQEEAV
ncbi:Protein CBR-RGS-2 [Caenorhabditis briggsae]|uniref:Protein CBR-RGS-2 n=1 Tax=Caenorhabditis briggsae TaxID=6238 RepID=A8WM97_CAEBR|nr:Protein CBR-RGS-2 [Caenorhabditis briggsae]CAP21601.2 Protein CBR-RGS-2 [Caenorhabditis briggsae]